MIYFYVVKTLHLKALTENILKVLEIIDRKHKITIIFIRNSEIFNIENSFKRSFFIKFNLVPV